MRSLSLDGPPPDDKNPLQRRTDDETKAELGDFFYVSNENKHTHTRLLCVCEAFLWGPLCYTRSSTKQAKQRAATMQDT